MAPGDLQEVLAVLRPDGTPPPAELLVGLGAADDAAVYRLSPDLAIVETVDFFPPVVDDPWTWGAVAAVNAMSDVYAMGGEVMFALAVAGFPREMAKDDHLRGIPRRPRQGGRGGRRDRGRAHGRRRRAEVRALRDRPRPSRPDLVKGGLRSGDRVFLSKPLGTGVVTTAAKNGVAGAERSRAQSPACCGSIAPPPPSRARAGRRARPTLPDSASSATPARWSRHRARVSRSRRLVCRSCRARASLPKRDSSAAA